MRLKIKKPWSRSKIEVTVFKPKWQEYIEY